MNIQVAGGALIVGALLAIAPSSNRSVAQTLTQAKDTTVSTPQSVTPNTHRASPLLALSRRKASTLWQPESPHLTVGDGSMRD